MSDTFEVYRVASITFSHSNAPDPTGAIPIRDTVERPLLPPEFKTDERGVVESSFPACYALRKLDSGQPLKIEVSLTGRPTTSGFVRARAIGSNREASPRRGFLGNLVSQPISFEASYAWNWFVNDSVLDVKTGIYQQTWLWQYCSTDSAIDSDWESFAVTSHTIYVILDNPSGCWSTLRSDCYGETRYDLPWADALDLACHWAEGVSATEPDAERKIAAAITNGLFNQGSIDRQRQGSVDYVKYSIANSYSFRDPYGDNIYFLNLQAFLDRIGSKTGIGRGWGMDCKDCASVVTALTALMGVSTGIAELSLDAKEPLMAHRLGFAVSNLTALNFGYHAVSVSPQGLVYDACLGTGNFPKALAGLSQQQYSTQVGSDLGDEFAAAKLMEVRLLRTSLVPDRGPSRAVTQLNELAAPVLRWGSRLLPSSVNIADGSIFGLDTLYSSPDGRGGYYLMGTWSLTSNKNEISLSNIHIVVPQSLTAGLYLRARQNATRMDPQLKVYSWIGPYQYPDFGLLAELVVPGAIISGSSSKENSPNISSALDSVLSPP